MLPLPEEPQRQHRRGCPQLHRHERRQQHDADAEGRHDPGRGPAGLVPLDQAVDQGQQPAGRQQGAPQVQPQEAAIAGFRHHPQAQQHQRHDRQVQPEHRIPVDLVHQQAAEDRPDRQPQRPHPGPDPDRHGSLLAREDVRDDRERRRQHQRRPRALDAAHEDQRLGAGRQRRPGGPGLEDDHPQREEPPPPEAVAYRAAQEQQPGQDQGVAVHHPLQRRHRGVQVPRDRRQRRVDHRVVQEDHQGRQRHHRQHQPAARGRAGDCRGGHSWVRESERFGAHLCGSPLGVPGSIAYRTVVLYGRMDTVRSLGKSTHVGT